MATAGPVSSSALPPLPSKALPLAAAIKPIKPDGPDAKPSHLLSQATQLGSADSRPTHFSRPLTTSRSSASSSHGAIAPSSSQALRIVAQDMQAQADDKCRPSGIGRVGSHKGQAVCLRGVGLPPIPHLAGSPTLPKGRTGKGRAHAASNAPDHIRNAGRSKADLKGASSGSPSSASTGARSKAAAGWNSDFSVQYNDPVSLKDQERALKMNRRGPAKQPLTPPGHRVQQLTGASTTAVQHGSAKSVRSHATHTCRSQLGGRTSGQHAVSCELDGVSVLDDWQPGNESCALTNCSSAYSRNLDSAQSPLRHGRAKHGSSIWVHGHAELDKALVTGLQVYICESEM